MALAGYIGVMTKPKNDREEAISMTAPVVSFKDDDGRKGMQFILPSANHANAPQPTNDAVNVVKKEARVMAVKTFNGTMTQDMHDEHKKELVEALKKAGLGDKMTEKWEAYRYNPPSLTIPYFKTNEVAVEMTM